MTILAILSVFFMVQLGMEGSLTATITWATLAIIFNARAVGSLTEERIEKKVRKWLDK